MAYSDPFTHSLVVEEIAKIKSDREAGGITEKLRILDAGIGAGSIGKELRASFGENVEIHGIDVWEPYKEKFPELLAVYDSLEYGERANFAIYLEELENGFYDVIIFGDSLEHVYPAWAEHSLYHAIRVAKEAVLVNTPIVPYSQGEVDGNPWETHYYAWNEDVWAMFGGKCLGKNEVVGCFVWRNFASDEVPRFQPLPYNAQPQPRFDEFGNINYDNGDGNGTKTEKKKKH